MTTTAPFLKALKLAALALATLVLASGCGFQLRGTSPVPAALQPLAVDCPDNLPGRFCQSVRDQLTLGGVQVADSAAQAVTIFPFRDTRRNGRPRPFPPQAAAAESVLRHPVPIDLL